jgi:hypothetical protein
MYIARYIFYKVDYPGDGSANITDVHCQTFGTPQLENSVTRVKRQEGFMTLRVNETIYKIIEATVKKDRA